MVPLLRQNLLQRQGEDVLEFGESIAYLRFKHQKRPLGHDRERG